MSEAEAAMLKRVLEVLEEWEEYALNFTGLDSCDNVCNLIVELREFQKDEKK